MKNEFHHAYTTHSNFPLQIASPDSVHMHVNDNIRLISMPAADWPKLRGRDFINPKVTDTRQLDGLKIQFLETDNGGSIYHGRLVNDKYYFAEDILNYSMPLEMMFLSFKENGIRPVVQKEWNPDYMPCYPFYYSLVEEDEVEGYEVGGEKRYPINGFEKLGIDCLADILAYSYKFTWDINTMSWEAITNEYEITKRIRKPWVALLIQREIGEQPHTTADLHKVVTFLVQKAETLMTDEEKAACEPFLRRPIGVDDLKGTIRNQRILAAIMEAYESEQLIKSGGDVRLTDPVFSFLDDLYQRKPDARYP